jgi:DNA-binding CsgD family transcriptional regulator
MRLGNRDQRGIDEITEIARTIEGRPRPVLEEVVPRLTPLLSADFASAYRASPGACGWHLDFAYGMPGRMKSLMVDFFAGTPSRRPFFTFDLLSPEPDQRNVVRRPNLNVPERTFRSSPYWARVIEPSIGPLDHMRVLLCDGPTLLAWVGGVRRDRFTSREAKILASLVGPLRTRVALEQRLLRADLLEKGIAAALDLTAETMVLCTRDGRVAHASLAARARVDSDPTLWPRLRASLRGLVVPGVTMSSVRVAGLPEHVLVSFGVPLAAADFGTRVRIVRGQWRLTERQSQVLGRVVHGDSNKQIAERFRCAENTVEVHVSALLRKAGVQSRAALAARFWTVVDN